jgi:hypothetical protein
VEGTAWVAMVWKRVVAEGVTTRVVSEVEGTAWVAMVWCATYIIKRISFYNRD